MLTLTEILVGLMLLVGLSRMADRKMRSGLDVIAAFGDLCLTGVVVWQFYFVMLPAAWGAR